MTFHAVAPVVQAAADALPLPDEGADEPRPRGGLLRVREFVMKDAYSFDRDEEGLDVSFRKQGAADRTFERCGLEVYAVEAESGMMGGSESLDYLAPSGSGENVLVTCENGDYAADLEIARGVPRAPEFPSRSMRRSRSRRRASRRSRRSRSSSASTGRDVEGDARRPRRRRRARARARRRPAGGGEARGGAQGRRPARDRGRDPHRVRRRPRSLGPVGFSGDVVADETLRSGQFVAGANRTRWRLRGVEHGRDFEARFADIRQSQEGDVCPKCGGRLRFQTAIEVGHIFKLGTYYSAPLGRCISTKQVRSSQS